MADASGKRKRERDKRMAARMKAEGIVRTTGRCSVCYKIVATEGPKSKYTHVCWK